MDKFKKEESSKVRSLELKSSDIENSNIDEEHVTYSQELQETFQKVKRTRQEMNM